jgi:uncharacterized membrane protein (UPF0127 family)
MRRKNTIISLFLIAAGAASLFYVFLKTDRLIVPPTSPALTERVVLDFTNVRVYAEIAATPAEKERGLSGRLTLSPDAGMLFVFSSPSRPGFWMKEMNFPLDFIYLRDGRVAEIKENVPAAIIPIPFFPAAEIDAVLEVNAGFVKRHGITVGATVGY